MNRDQTIELQGNPLCEGPTSSTEPSTTGQASIGLTEEKEARYEHVCITTDMPCIIQFLSKFILGRNHYFVPICLVLFCFAMTVVDAVHRISYFVLMRDWLRDQGEDVDGYNDSLWITLVPELVFYAFLWVELVANIHFGRWMAQSRHLEEFATRICAPDKSGNAGKVDKASCMDDLERLASRVLPSVILIVFLVPNVIYFIVDLQLNVKRQKTLDESDDPERSLLTLVLSFTLTPVLTLTLTRPLLSPPTPSIPPTNILPPILLSLNFIASFITISISFTFYIIWYWICLESYRYTQRHANALESKDFSSAAPLAAFIGSVSLLQEVSEPWSFSWIVRAVSMFYRFYFKFIGAMYFAFLAKHASDLGLSKNEEQGAIFVMGINILVSLTYMFMLVMTAMITGYIGDAFIKKITQRVRLIMGDAQDNGIRVCGVEFLSLLSAYRGEAGLLFGGIEMSVEKAFYLVTAVAYLNGQLITNIRDPFEGVDFDDDGNDLADDGGAMLYKYSFQVSRT